MPDSKPERRIFVAGEHGQLARALARAYSARGDSIRCVGRNGLDVADRAAVMTEISAFGPALVVNAAAYTAVDKAEDEPDRASLVNRDGAAHLAIAAHAVGAPIIHMSTDYVFDGTKSGLYVETDTAHPLGVYGVSKWAGEQAVQVATPAHAILRTSWVCSPDGNNFVKTILRLAQERDEIGVVDDQWGAPSFAADLAAAICRIGDHLLAETHNATLYGIYHIANSGETTWCRLAQAIVSRSAHSRNHNCRIRAITTAEYPTRARRPANSRLDCSKLQRVFGIKLADWQSSLGSCLDQLMPTAAGISA